MKKIIAFLTAFSLISLSSCGNIVERIETPSVHNGTISRDDNEIKPAVIESADSDTEDDAPDAASTAPAVNNVTMTTTTTTAPIPRGNLYDADGDVLIFGDKDSNGREVRRANDVYKVPFANILNEMSEGLDLTYDDILRTPNPTLVDCEEVGQSIQLTYDAATQKAVYDYMESMNFWGSAVVMRSDGSIMAQVAYPSYDPDEYYGKKTDEDLAWGTYGNKTFQNFPPGSCFKIMSEVISDKHGIYSEYDEGTWAYDGVTIVNWDHNNTWNYPQQRSLYSAFINSSNIFFAKSFDDIGREAVLDDLDKIFHFVSPIECDFGTIKNNIEIYCNDDLRRSAFGQSYVMTCPIYLAALGREAAYGEMVRPFTIKNVVDTTDFGSVLQQGSKQNDVIGTIPKEYRQNLLDGMSGVGSGLGVVVPSGYSFYAKTGTAETWEGDFLYITGILRDPDDDGKGVYKNYSDYHGSYIIVMQVRNPGYFGYAFAGESGALYQGLVNAVVN